MTLRKAVVKGEASAYERRSRAGNLVLVKLDENIPHLLVGVLSRCSSLILLNRVSLPRYGSRVGQRIGLFEACSAFTRVPTCTLALSRYFVTRYPKASAISFPP
jgi:hypothetical protein